MLIRVHRKSTFSSLGLLSSRQDVEVWAVCTGTQHHLSSPVLLQRTRRGRALPAALGLSQPLPLSPNKCSSRKGREKIKNSKYLLSPNHKCLDKRTSPRVCKPQPCCPKSESRLKKQNRKDSLLRRSLWIINCSGPRVQSALKLN